MKVLFSILGFVGFLLAIPILVVSLLLGLPIIIRSKRAYMNFILLAVANSLKIFFIPLGFVYAFFKMRKDELPQYMKDAAVSEDQTGGVYSSELFDDILTKDHSEQFGNPDETISSVLGKNQESKNLSILGRIIGLILDIAEPGHLTKSIGK